MADGPAAAPRRGKTADRIAFLGHATVLMDVNGVRLITDPLLRRGVAHLRRQVAPVDAEMTATVDAVLISHLHHDHLDLRSLRLLGQDRPLVVPAGAGSWLRRHGFTRVSELSVGEALDVRGLAVTAVEARHDTRRAPRRPPAATLGYLVGGDPGVYFAGDTELFEEMSTLPAGLDLALLPVAGWGPTLGPGHMDPLEAARAAALIRPRVAIPIHWGTLLPIGSTSSQRARLGEPAEEFARHVGEIAPSVEVRVLAPGEETTL